MPDAAIIDRTLDALRVSTDPPPGHGTLPCPQCSNWIPLRDAYTALDPRVNPASFARTLTFCNYVCAETWASAWQAALPACGRCGEPHSANMAAHFEGGLVEPLCGYCYARVICPSCNQARPRDGSRIRTGVCQLCQPDLPNCAGCAVTIPWDSGLDVDGADYCNGCAVTCGACSETILADDASTTVSEDYVCDNCLGEYELCNECERYVYRDSAQYDDDSDAYYCWHCYDSRSRRYDESELIQNYSYKPTPHFDGRRHVEPGNALYMGVELEVEVRSGESVDEAAHYGTGQLGDIAYLKSDSSIRRGFEIVTHPLSFEYWQKKFPAASIEAGSNLYRSYGYDTTGFHIHLSKAAFGNLHLYKFCRFHYDNQALIEAVAQRSSPEWAAFRAEDKEFLVAYAKQKAGNYSRYVPVNMQNADTVELRYFKGNILAQAIRKNVQFAHAVYMFSKDNPLRAMNADKFCMFVSEHASDYRELRWYMNAKGYSC